MLAELSNQLSVYNPSEAMKNWARKTLIIDNPDYIKHKRMSLWTKGIPKKLALYEERDNTIKLPFGCFHWLPEEIFLDFITIVPDFATRPPVEYDANIPLYDYQKTAVNIMLHARGGILQSPAGSGKTQMGLALAVELKKKTLWLCHTLDLVRQSKERAEQLLKKKHIGLIAEGKVSISEGITFATVQTMSKTDLTALKHEWDCVIVDEVHRVSGSPTAMTQYMKVLNALSAPYKYGLSATVHRADGMIIATYALIGMVAHAVSLDDVEDKIMRVGINAVGTGVQLDREALNTDGTLNYTRLINFLAEHEARNQLIADMLDDRPSLILSDRISQLKNIMGLLPAEKQEQAVIITGKMTSITGKKARVQALDDMRDGKKKYLFATYKLAKEGLDVPCLEKLYLASPQKDYAIVTQSIGRVARTHEGKQDPIVYDYVDDVGYLVKSWKKRCAVYKRNNCYFMEANE